MNNDLNRKAIENLTHNEGWKLVETFISERVDSCKSRLVTCKLEEVMDQRSKIDAYNSIFKFMNDILEDDEVNDESTN